MKAAARRKCSGRSARPAMPARAASAARSARPNCRTICASTIRPAGSKRPPWPAMWRRSPASREPHRRHRPGGGRPPKREGRLSRPPRPSRRRGGGRPRTNPGSRSIRLFQHRAAHGRRECPKRVRHAHAHRPKPPRSTDRWPRRLLRRRLPRKTQSRMRPTGRRRRYLVPSRRVRHRRGPTTSPIDPIFWFRAFPRRLRSRHRGCEALRRLPVRKILPPRRSPPPARFARDARGRPRRAQAARPPRRCAPP
jgi:hypothetical protein